MNQLAITQPDPAAVPTTILGQRPAMQVPIGGVIRPGIKILTQAAQQNDAARTIYERGCAQGKDFDTIENEVRQAAPNLKAPLRPANVPYFSVRRADFPMPELADMLVEKYGETREDGLRRLYRFPVIFAADSWEQLMPHNLQVWAAVKRKYWAHFVRYYGYTAYNFHFMEIHARSHEKLRDHPELIAQAEQMVSDSIQAAAGEVDELIARANQMMADNGDTQSVRCGAGPLLVPAEIVSPHCATYLTLLMKADRLFGLLEYQRLRGYITNEASDKEFARVDRLLKGIQRTALRLATGLRRRLNFPQQADSQLIAQAATGGADERAGASVTGDVAVADVN